MAHLLLYHHISLFTSLLYPERITGVQKSIELRRGEVVLAIVKSFVAVAKSFAVIVESFVAVA